MIELQKVKSSSNIAAVGYDGEKLILIVEFTTGDQYRYYNVPSSLHEQLLKADSVGKFFAVWIKGKFTYDKILGDKHQIAPEPETVCLLFRASIAMVHDTEIVELIDVFKTEELAEKASVLDAEQYPHASYRRQVRIVQQ